MRVLLFGILFIFQTAWAQKSMVKVTSSSNHHIDEFDLRRYAYGNYGLKDLVFEVRSPQILEQLSKNESLGKLVDVYYKVYWVYPGKFNVRVEGLPKGNDVITLETREIIKPLLDSIFPDKLSNVLRSYKIKNVSSKKDKKVLATDESGTRGVTEIELVFDSQGRLTNTSTRGLNGRVNSKYKFSVKSWSNNKWVLDRIVTTLGSDNQGITSDNEIKYSTQAGFGLPEKIVSTSRVQVGKNSQESVREFLFSKYEVNTGKALKAVMSP